MKTFKKTDKQKQAIDLIGSTKAGHYLWFGGSRSGKTFLNIYIIVYRALKYAGSRHLVCRKTLQSCKSSIVKDTLRKVFDICFPNVWGMCKMNYSDWYLTFPNGSTIWFGGVGNVDEVEKLLGNEYATIFINEVSEVYYRAVLKLRTRLAQNIAGCRNYILYDCNPPSRSHWSYKEFIENVSPMDSTTSLDGDNYKHLLLNPLDNMLNLSEDYIKELQGLPENERNRFLFGLWQEEVEGAILGKEIAEAEQEGRIGDFPYIENYPVYTAWDIGHSDSTAIWFFQVVEGQVRYINYLENCLEGLPYYIQQLRARPYVYETDFFPHDGNNTEWAQGKTRKAVAITEYQRNVVVLPRLGKQEQISIARSLFRFCVFNKKTTLQGLDKIRNYRYVFDEKLGVLKDKEPYHDENSHGGDAFLYSLVAYDKKKEYERIKTVQERENEILEEHRRIAKSISENSNKISLPSIDL